MSLLVDQLRRTADVRGDAVAFGCGPSRLTYGELVERAHRLANALVANGVRPGDRVGILMGKGIDNPVAVYGIMAAGAAYVPLDPAAPVARLASIVHDCVVEHLVVDAERGRKAAKLASLAPKPLTVYGVDEVAAAEGVPVTVVGWADIDRLASTAPAVSAGIDDPAYLIFTSGSTGVPKGIVHTHRSGSAYARMSADLYGLGPEDRLSNFPPLHFDQSTFDFFAGPLVGASTIIIDQEHQLVPASLSQLIEDERLTIWYSVPLALVQLLLYGVLEERDHSSLRWVIYGGEPFPLKHLRALMDRWPRARFSNCYGPAEVNQCSYHHLDGPADLPSDEAEGAGVPIGVACPGMDLLVVDAAGQPVAADAEGELLVATPTMMRGYWDRPDLDERVFHDVVEADGVRRYYRTGDLVRRRADGLHDFLGRADRQIKTRGVRVELDEVEAVLSAHDGVEEVAVAPIPDEDGLAIAAWVSTRPGVELDAGALRRHAAGRLSRPAVPATISFVDGFPRTTSGKIDYLALTARGVPQ